MKLEGVEKGLAVVRVYISTVKDVDYYTIFHFHLHEQKSNNGICIKYNDVCYRKANVISALTRL